MTSGLAEAAAEISRRFRLGRLVAEPTLTARGKQGVIWRFVTDRGAYAVKQLLVRTTPASVATDTAFMLAIADRGEVLLPRPVRTADGEELAEVGPHQVRVSHWVDLVGTQARLDPESVGALLAALHRDPLPAPGPVDRWYVEGVAASAWEELAVSLRLGRAPFALEFEQFAATQQDLQDLLAEPTHVQLCHRDLWLENLPLAAGGRICVVDWDNCGPADPGQELAMILYEQCYDDPARAATLMAAYRRRGGPGVLDGPESFTMTLAQLGHFAVTAARRWLVAAGDERSRMEAWFREGYDQPLDRRRIDGFLRGWTR